MLADETSQPSASAPKEIDVGIDADDNDVDDLLLELEKEEDNDDALANIRERRMAQLRKEYRLHLGFSLHR